jgi:TatD DNase family protein
MFIDTHAHLFYEDFGKDFTETLKRATDVRVEKIVVPGTDLATSLQAIKLAESHDMIYACTGFHPHEAAKAGEAELAEIEKIAVHPRVVAIGEIGLDYHYDFSPREMQRDVFRAQIKIAQRLQLPIVIHSRESDADVLESVEECMKGNPQWRQNGNGELRKGVFHCFSGDVAMAEKVIGWGFYISIPGPVTFTSKPSKPNVMKEVVTAIPMEHILVETDSPYLAPVPLRGKRNEPANIPVIAAEIARLKNISIEEVAAVSSASARNLFQNL